MPLASHTLKLQATVRYSISGKPQTRVHAEVMPETLLATAKTWVAAGVWGAKTKCQGKAATSLKFKFIPGLRTLSPWPETSLNFSKKKRFEVHCLEETISSFGNYLHFVGQIRPLRVHRTATFIYIVTHRYIYISVPIFHYVVISDYYLPQGISCFTRERIA